jgi:hypothetical protein
MPVTRWQLALRAAQQPVAAALKPLGFRKGGNFFNRQSADGLVQVVGFQSGQAISILHGSFTVNLGVYVPVVAECEGNEAKGRYVTDAHCEIRSRLSAVARVGSDVWWPLDDTAGKSGELISDSLVEAGVPFLDRYGSYASIIARFEADGSLPFHNPGRSALVVALICRRMRDEGAADRFFQRAVSLSAHHAGFRAHVEKLRDQHVAVGI